MNQAHEAAILEAYPARLRALRDANNYPAYREVVAEYNVRFTRYMAAFYPLATAEANA